MTSRPHAIAAVAFGLLLLAGCRQTPETDPAAESGTSEAVQAPAAEQRPSTAVDRATADQSPCPSDEFQVFFDAFTDSMSVQKAFTRWPLASVSLDPAAQPEPAQVTRQIARHQATFPLLMTVQRAAQDGLEVSVQELGDGRTIVTYAKPDTDYQLRYRFRFNGQCWQLVGIQDDSL